MDAIIDKLVKGRKTILEYIDIHKSFGSKEIYKGLNLKIQKGETLCNSIQSVYVYQLCKD